MADKKASFRFLPDGRSCLPEGTVIALTEGSGCYMITGAPVGYGGTGILYPAVPVARKGNDRCPGMLRTVIKEWFPAGLVPAVSRDETGRVTWVQEDGNVLCCIARQELLRESEITADLSGKGFHPAPVLRVAERVCICLPGVRAQNPAQYVFTYPAGILELPDGKLQSLPEVLSGRNIPGRMRSAGLNGWQCFHLIDPILRTLDDVHKAGYLHGDLQEHTIFVRNKEEDGMRQEAVLADFGSARILLEDGATEAIARSLFFPLKGSTAPECFDRSNKALRLTPAADLYSAGVLLLRMLNGRMPDRRSLQIAVDGRYLLYRRAKQIGIPPQMVPAVNECLTGFFREDPYGRYQSVQEALAVCDQIRKALVPQNGA